MTIHISIATPGKLRPAMTSIPTYEGAGLQAWKYQVLYYQHIGYTEIACKGSCWMGDNGNSVVTITVDKEQVKS